MSRLGNHAATGKLCSFQTNCNGDKPEYRHWPYMAVLQRPNGADPGLKALQAAGFSGYCVMCHDCFEGVWAPG